MLITVIGASGMVGSRVVAEAAARGHQVAAATRHDTAVPGAYVNTTIDLTDTAAVVNAIASSDATVIAVPTDRSGGSAEPTIDAHRQLIAAQPVGRFLVVGGAGSLVVDGVLLKDSPDFPDAYLPEATAFTEILDLYRACDDVDWTMVSPAPEIGPGERTGTFRIGDDSPVGAHVSAEDFAVAIVDELEHPQHLGRRFTVAN